MKGLGLHRWRRMSLTGQDTRTGKPPLSRRNNRGEEFVRAWPSEKNADEGTRTPMSFLART